MTNWLKSLVLGGEVSVNFSAFGYKFDVFFKSGVSLPLSGQGSSATTKRNVI